MNRIRPVLVSMAIVSAVILINSSGAQAFEATNIKATFRNGYGDIHYVFNITKLGKIFIVNNGSGSGLSGTNGCQGNRSGANRSADVAQIGGNIGFRYKCNRENSFSGTGSATLVGNDLTVRTLVYNNGMYPTTNDYTIRMAGTTCSGGMVSTSITKLVYNIVGCSVGGGLRD